MQKVKWPLEVGVFGAGSQSNLVPPPSFHVNDRLCESNIDRVWKYECNRADQQATDFSLCLTLSRHLLFATIRTSSSSAAPMARRSTMESAMLSWIESSVLTGPPTVTTPCILIENKSYKNVCWIIILSMFLQMKHLKRHKIHQKVDK